MQCVAFTIPWAPATRTPCSADSSRRPSGKGATLTIFDNSGVKNSQTRGGGRRYKARINSTSRYVHFPRAKQKREMAGVILSTFLLYLRFKLPSENQLRPQPQIFAVFLQISDNSGSVEFHRQPGILSLLRIFFRDYSLVSNQKTVILRLPEISASIP